MYHFFRPFGDQTDGLTQTPNIFLGFDSTIGTFIRLCRLLALPPVVSLFDR